MQAPAHDYAGFSIAEKKEKRQYEPHYDALVSALKAKLGEEWTVKLDWPEFEKHFKTHTSRARLGEYVYEKNCKPLAAELPGWDQEIVDAVNAVVKGKVLRITLDTSGNVSAYASVKFTPEAIVWGHDPNSLGYQYPYSERNRLSSYAAKDLEGNSAVALKPGATVHDYTGFTIEEKKEKRSREQNYEDALAALKARCGADWKLTIDWPGLQKSYTGHSSRARLGEYVYDNLCKPLAAEIPKWEQEVVDALNDTVKGKTLAVVIDPSDPSNYYSVKVTPEAIVMGWALGSLGYVYPYSQAYTIHAHCEKQL